jgi:hypothetical protein
MQQTRERVSHRVRSVAQNTGYSTRMAECSPHLQLTSGRSMSAVVMERSMRSIERMGLVCGSSRRAMSCSLHLLSPMEWRILEA